MFDNAIEFFSFFPFFRSTSDRCCTIEQFDFTFRKVHDSIDNLSTDKLPRYILYRQFLTSHHRLLNRSPRKRHRSSLDIIPPLPQEEGNLSSYYLGSLMNTRSRSHERVQYPGETSNTLKTVFVIRKLFEGETQDGGGGGPGWDQARTNEARFGAETKGRRTNGERRRVIACIHVSKWPGVC